ncbi:MAG TPA: WD40 repeat domain-containing serine/threonine-protein kinase [Verrucomicrobiae bacterium]
MPETSKCPECGTELPRFSLKGICPRCIAKVAFGPSADAELIAEAFSTGESSQRMHSADSVPPSPEESRNGWIGRYKLLEQIGEGGFGVVHLAEQVEPVRRKVALKVIKAGMDTRAVVARFEAERQALALMDHPNIARVLDAGATETGRPYFVMELVKGLPVTGYCDQHRLAPTDRLKLFIRVCHAVQHAHQKGIIHRDLKPSNVLVSLQDGEAVPKVIDFGIAKALGQKLTEKTLFTGFDQMIGTPAYMSPEQAENNDLDVDTRSDVYSLGVLLYELLTGTTPFQKETLARATHDEVRRLIRETEPPTPSTRLRSLGIKTAEVAEHRQLEPAALSRLVSGDLDWIVMKCLEKERTRRYESADNLALDVQRYLDNEPVTAAAPGKIYRAGKFVRRHKTGLAVTVSLALLLIAGTVVSTWQAVRASHASALAVRREAQARTNEWTSYLTAARAGRRSDEIGQRFETLAVVAKAAAIRPARELRSEFASALGLVDLRVARQWQVPTGAAAVVFDPAFDRYARSDHGGNLSVMSTRDDRVLFQAPGGGGLVFLSPVFSRNGRYLAALFEHSPERGRRIQVWDTQTARPVLKETLQVYDHALDFHPAKPILAVADETGTLRFVDWEAQRSWSWPPFDKPPNTVRFGPDGKVIGVHSPEAKLALYEFDTGNKVIAFPTATGGDWSWSSDGKWLAVPSDDGQVYIYDMEEGAKLERRWIAHQHVVTRVCFDPQGDFLFSQSWDGTAALWRLPTGSLVLRWPGCDARLSFSQDGRWLGPDWVGQTVRYFEVERAPECRVLFAEGTKEDCEGSFSPESRWVVIGSAIGLQCWSAITGRRIWVEPIGYVRSATFRPDGRALLTIQAEGAREWPWERDSATGLPRLGKPRQLTGFAGSPGAYSEDSSVLVIPQLEGLWVSDARVPTPVTLPMRMCNFAAVSPDGQWAAASPWREDADLKVWKLPEGKEVYCRTNTEVVVCFSANNQWLVIHNTETTELIATGTWRSVARWTHDRGSDLPFALSPDSRWIATRQKLGQIRICSLPGFEPVLDLNADPESALCFSPDGRFLLTRRFGSQFAIWDLARIKEKLDPMGLGW